jgi:hypothetical protein
MIDYKTIQKLNTKPGGPGDIPPEYLDQAIMVLDSPPEPMLLLLPHLIQGYNMLSKKWGAYAPAPYRIWPLDANFIPSDS